MYSSSKILLGFVAVLLLFGCQTASNTNYTAKLNAQNFNKLEGIINIGRFTNYKGEGVSKEKTYISDKGTISSTDVRINFLIEGKISDNNYSTKFRLTDIDYDIDDLSSSKLLDKVIGKNFYINSKIVQGELTELTFDTDFEIADKDREKISKGFQQFHKINLFENSIKFGDKFLSASIQQFEIGAIAVGIRKYKNRNVIVGKIFVDGDIENAEININGYVYLDIKSGIIIFSNASFLIGKDNSFIKFSQIYELNLYEVSLQNNNRTQKHDLDNYEKKCISLGFRKGTEKYGDCVMTLLSR